MASNLEIGLVTSDADVFLFTLVYIIVLDTKLYSVLFYV
jgi:hypothetical protein